MNKKEKILIVGAGLAGSILGYHIYKKYNCPIQIIDAENFTKASIVAAGIYNPVVFKRFVCSWKADELISYLDDFYTELERDLKVNFHFKKEILKLFSDEEEISLWKNKSGIEELNKFTLTEPINNFREDVLVKQKAFGKVMHAGNVNTTLFLSAIHEYFEKNKLIRKELFDYQLLKIENDQSITYKVTNYNKIIFCEGHSALKNPWFNWLEFKLTKGELLTISAKLNIDREVINKGVYILPIGNNIYKVGATYDWNKLDDTPTEKGLNELKDKLDKLIKVPYQIISHEAGIRPTVKDRRPLIGKHPLHPCMYIFNGLGTKGVMLAPYFANQLAKYIFENIELDQEVNISRFWKQK